MIKPGLRRAFLFLPHFYQLFKKKTHTPYEQYTRKKKTEWLLSSENSVVGVQFPRSLPVKLGLLIIAESRVQQRGINE